MLKIKNIIALLFMGILLIGCGSDRADDISRANGVLGVVEADRDGDGISDEDEVNIYHTNPDNNDTDGDGLSDGEEVIIYDTNASDPDSDDDSLLDGEEVHHPSDPSNPLKKDTDSDGILDPFEVKGYPEYHILAVDLNASNPDTDGDCLRDSDEVWHYKTKPNEADTDQDGIADGLEIYDNLNLTCGDKNETLPLLTETPAIDNMPLVNDVIDALDPTNDSDGDGWANVKELNCTGGNPKVAAQTCESLSETPIGREMASYGYSFVPGAFDVDGDGVNEGGFWVSIYQATEKDENVNEIEPLDVINIAQINGSYNDFIASNFKVLNTNSPMEGYEKGRIVNVQAGNLVTFKESDIISNGGRKATKPRYVDVTPFMALVSLSKVKFTDTDQNELNVPIGMLTNKQYSHILKLLQKDKEVNGANDATYVPLVKNGLLGVDINVPVANYSLNIKEFDAKHREFTQNSMYLRDVQGQAQFDDTQVEEWWLVANESKSRLYPVSGNGANSAFSKKQGGGHDNGGTTSDRYGVIVRGGELINLREGIAGRNGELNKAIGFRAATPYLY